MKSIKQYVAALALMGLGVGMANAAILSCRTTDYQQTDTATNKTMDANKSIGTRFKVDTSDGFATSDMLYKKEENFNNQGAVTRSTVIDRVTGVYVSRTNHSSGASNVVTAACKKVDVTPIL